MGFGESLDAGYAEEILEVVLRGQKKGCLQGAQGNSLGFLGLDFLILEGAEGLENVLVGSAIARVTLDAEMKEER